MKMCAVQGCYQRTGKNSTVSFYALPLKQPKILAEWIKLLGKTTPTTALVCSNHFQDDMFCTKSQRQKNGRLKWNAIPSIFIKSRHQQNSVLNTGR
jgi:hypothetical protein